MKAPTEQDIQRQCLDYLQGVLRWHAWRNNTGAMRWTDRAGGNRLMRFGATGSADILGVCCDGRFLAVEVKRPGGRPTEAQVAWLDRVRESGGVAMVVTSLEELRQGLSRAGYEVP